MLEHESGVLTTVLMSFDVWATRLPRIEVFGTGGTLSVPDPNTFDGEVEIWTPQSNRGQGGWRPLPVAGGYAGAGRGVGVADMARAIRTGGPHRRTAPGGRIAGVPRARRDGVTARGSRRGPPGGGGSTVERPAAVPLGATPDVA